MNWLITGIVMAPQKPWQEVAATAQKRREDSLALIQPPIALPETLPLNVTKLPAGILSVEELDITEQNAERLLARLAARKLSSVTVTHAFLRRALLAQKLVSHLCY